MLIRAVVIKGKEYCIVDMFTSFFSYVTGPAKMDQVGTKYTISQNGTYLEFYVPYLLSVSCKILPMKLLSDCKNFMYIALSAR